VAPRPRGGEGARRVRAHRGGRRLRRGRHEDHRHPGRWRLGHQRLQGVHHQLRHADHLARHRHGGDRAGRAQRRGQAGDQCRPDGFTVAPSYSKVGWNASDTHELAFSDCRVPEENLIGQRGKGYGQFLSILDEGRVAIAALATGAAQGCIDESVRYAHERHAFGAAIGTYQAIQFKIAEMESRTVAARLAWHDAAEKMAAGKSFTKEAAIAKLLSSNAAMDNAREATQIFGGYGFMNEYPVARHYRDSKILEIGEGTSEVQKMLIARRLGL
jgi:alkylation response protein AidB-like acyl-CoA dehydrogenase